MGAYISELTGDVLGKVYEVQAQDLDTLLMSLHVKFADVIPGSGSSFSFTYDQEYDVWDGFFFLRKEDK